MATEKNRQRKAQESMLRIVQYSLRRPTGKNGREVSGSGPLRKRKIREILYDMWND